MVSFVSGQQEGTVRCESQKSSKSIWILLESYKLYPISVSWAGLNKKTEIWLIDFNLEKNYDKLKNT